MVWRTESNKTLDQAARWNVRLDAGEELSDSERAAFHGWLEDPRHCKEFERQRVLLALIEELPPELKADIERTAFPEEAEAPVRRFSPGGPLLLRLRPFFVAAMVVLIAVIWGGWTLMHPAAEVSYASKIGEVLKVTLPDGSIASLNTATRLKWTGTDRDRRVVLQDGEVLLQVVHDERHPFWVLLDQSKVRVLGTQFDVYRKSNGSVVVTVISGSVAVDGCDHGRSTGPCWHATLTANQKIEYTSADPIPTIRSVVASESVDWIQGMLVFKGASLSTVVSELNRYTTKHIIIGDPSLNNFEVGGGFDVRYIPEGISSLDKFFPIVVTQTDDAFILTRRSDSPSVTHAEETNRP
jgi:transmembrane sensor